MNKNLTIRNSTAEFLICTTDNGQDTIEVKELDDFEKEKFEFDEFNYQNIFNKITQGRRLIKNNQPNYKVMEIFISAIQKLIIKDVILYADKKIATSKEVFNDK
ncbi:MAG: hypothetical protein ACI9TV_001870 [Sulfurimonas sp.]|jgi:hypothetical protein|uniref:hypothetical protein n=1 Tax=Sulfurimonas sp. TaxID=2022749 RepID=UPI0039E2D168